MPESPPPLEPAARPLATVDIATAEPPAPPRSGKWSRGKWVEDGPEAMALSAGPVATPAGPSSGEVEDTGRDLHLQGIRIPFKWELTVYGSVFLTALVMRLWDLGARAVHHDESLHGTFSWQVYNGTGYNHNPLTHGMWLFHSTAGGFFLFGDSDFTLRLTQALFGSVLVLIPWVMRPRLGTVGAIAASLMLAFSPSLLYFSRFAREDIYMAVWLLGIVALVWRFMDEGKNRYLYGAAALMAFAFATKETTYMFVAIIGAALFAMGSSDVGRWVWGRASIKEWKRPAQALLVIGGIAVPLFAAGIGWGLQKLTGTTLTAADGTPGLAPGAPQTDARWVAGAIVVALMGGGLIVGVLWNRRVWLIAALVFWSVFLLLFTNFLTHPGGAATGVWQSLGYWLAQHNVRRGDQPWYYYFILVHVYEFLPWLIAIATVGYYAFKKTSMFTVALAVWTIGAIAVAMTTGSSSALPWILMGALLLATVPLMPADRYTKFLVFWAGATFLAYSVAGEKMPWLLVHISVPLVILAARSVNGVANAVDWRRVGLGRAALAVPGVTLLILFVYRLAVTDDWRNNVWLLWIILAGLGLLGLALYELAKRSGGRPMPETGRTESTSRSGWTSALGIVGLAFASLLLLLTVRASFVAAYKNGDVPREMLIYTQTSPALHQLVQEIKQTGLLTTDRENLKVSIDTRSGFAWPWYWYLRDFTDVSYPDYTNAGTTPAPDTKIVVIHRDNNAQHIDAMGEAYEAGRKLPHRWWFPEIYREVTPSEFAETFQHRTEWPKFIDFFLYRKIPQRAEDRKNLPFGSEDAYAYFNKDLPLR